MVDRTVEVVGECGQSDDRTIGRVFVDSVGCRVGVGDGSDVELIDIGQVDGKDLSRETAVSRGGSDRDLMRDCVFVVQQAGVCHGHDASRRVDGEPSASRVVQRVSDCIGGGVSVAGRCSDANQRAVY